MKENYSELKTIAEMTKLHEKNMGEIVQELNDIPRAYTDIKIIRAISAMRRDIIKRGHDDIMAYVAAVNNIDIFYLKITEINALYDVLEKAAIIQ